MLRAVGFPAVVVGAVLRGERLEERSRPVDEREGERVKVRCDDEPRVAELLRAGRPTLTGERFGDVLRVTAVDGIEEMPYQARLGRVAAEAREMLEHARVGLARVVDALDAPDVALPRTRTHAWGLPDPGRSNPPRRRRGTPGPPVGRHPGTRRSAGGRNRRSSGRSRGAGVRTPSRPAAAPI